MHPVMHPEKNGKPGKMGGNGGKWGKRVETGGQKQGGGHATTTRYVYIQPSIFESVQNKLLQTAIVMQHHRCTVSLTLHPALPLIPDPLSTLHVA